MSERWRRPSLFVHQCQRCPFALGCEFVYLQREDIFRSRWRMKWARRNNALTDALEKGLCLLFRFRVLSSSSITLEGRKSIASMCAQVISFTHIQWDERDSNFLESVNREGLRLLLIKAHRAGQQRQCSFSFAELTILMRTRNRNEPLTHWSSWRGHATMKGGDDNQIIFALFVNCQEWLTSHFRSDDEDDKCVRVCTSERRKDNEIKNSFSTRAGTFALVCKCVSSSYSLDARRQCKRLFSENALTDASHDSSQSSFCVCVSLSIPWLISSCPMHSLFSLSLCLSSLLVIVGVHFSPTPSFVRSFTCSPSTLAGRWWWWWWSLFSSSTQTSKTKPLKPISRIEVGSFPLSLALSVCFPSWR